MTERYVLACPAQDCGFTQSFDEAEPRGICPNCRRHLTLLPADGVTDDEITGFYASMGSGDG